MREGLAMRAGQRDAGVIDVQFILTIDMHTFAQPVSGL
jgi:hypothetical protein